MQDYLVVADPSEMRTGQSSSVFQEPQRIVRRTAYVAIAMHRLPVMAINPHDHAREQLAGDQGIVTADFCKAVAAVFGPQVACQSRPQGPTRTLAGGPEMRS